MGLVGPSVLPGLGEREQIVPSLAEKFLPTFFLMMLAGAAISASLSTVVSVLLSRGSIITYNVLVPTRPNLSEAARVRFVRGCAIALGRIVLAIAPWPIPGPVSLLADRRDILALLSWVPWPLVLVRERRSWPKSGAERHQLITFSAY